MSNCSSYARPLFVSILSILLIALSSGHIHAQNEKTVEIDINFIIEIYSVTPPEIWKVAGPCSMEYSEPYPDPMDPEYQIIDTEIVELTLKGNGIKATKNDGIPSPGETRSQNPGIDFPAESFFDVYFEIELPGVLPGDTLFNYDPVHIESLINQFPPYYEHYSSGMIVPLYNQHGAIVGEIQMCEADFLPYYPPRAHLYVPTAYRSEVAVINEGGLLEMSAALSGRRYYEETDIYCTFEYRELGDPGPFTPISTDYNAAGPSYSTFFPMGTGNCFTTYFEPGSEPFEEHVYETRAAIWTPSEGFLYDTVVVMVDGTPPIPKFNDIEKDDIPEIPPDSFFDVTYRLDDEMTGPGTAELQVLPLQMEFSRPLTPVDQLGLGTANDSTSCLPAAAASCLKYFADNGESDLDNPEGDEDKPDASVEEMARELAGAMGTDSNGTTTGQGVAGIQSYLGSHGKSGWTVSGHSVENSADLGEMLREFEADSEDVLVLLKDTTAAGDTIGHAVTLGSKTTVLPSPEGPDSIPTMKLDFMDPWGGGTQEDNNYDVGQNGSGEPTMEGYHLESGGGSAWVSGYIKVSPPEGGGGGPASPGRDIGRAPSVAPWMVVDAGIVNGNGVVDTLRWDTHGFAPGLYLMEIVTIDDGGWQCRDLRLVGIPVILTGDDPVTPPFKTNLRGSYPNPFNPSTTIEYSLAARTKVTLAIYDVSGRRVKTLIDGEMRGEGVHRENWDGTSERGSRVASGVYFCLFRAEGQLESRKLIMLR